MDTTPLSAIPLNVTRSVLDTGSRLFLFKHSIETETGYEPLDTGDINGMGEVFDNWLLERNRFNQHILTIAAIDPITTDLLEDADAIGYIGLANANAMAGNCQAFEINQASFPRSNEDRICEFTVQFVKIMPDVTPYGLPGGLAMPLGAPI